MSLERWDGCVWLTCDGCESETDSVPGDLHEAEVQAKLEGWECTEQGWLCKYCMAQFIPLDTLMRQATEAMNEERARLIAEGVDPKVLDQIEKEMEMS